MTSTMVLTPTTRFIVFLLSSTYSITLGIADMITKIQAKAVGHIILSLINYELGTYYANEK